jgi:hypothetical protein
MLTTPCLAAGADRNSDDTETWISRKDQKRIKRDILARKRADKLGTHSAPVECSYRSLVC